MRKNIEKSNTKSRFNTINDAKGITLTTLVVTIIVLLILAGVATYSGIEAIANTKRTKFIAELKIMQTHVNQWYEDLKPSNTETKTFEEKISDYLTTAGATKVYENGNFTDTKAKDTFKSSKLQEIVKESEYPNFFLISTDACKQNLGIEGVEQSVMVNVTTRKVVSYLGLKYKNEMYYTLEANDLNAIYNVGYQTPTPASPTINVTGIRLENGKSAKINIATKYNANNVNKGTIYYGIVKDGQETATSYNTTQDDYFVITENGKYDIYVKDAAGNESAHVIKKFSKDANSPKLTDGMIPIKWVEGNENTPSNWVVCDKNDIDWFSYDHKLWANIMLSDGTYKADTVQVGQVVQENQLGSMYVWIPRYAYKMPENSYTDSEIHTIDVTFLNRTTNRTSTGKEIQKATADVNTMQTPIVHPAFTFGDKELEGIWVAKFEASGTNENGDAVGNSSPDATTYSPVTADSTTIVRSIPNVPSWRGIRIGDCEWQSMSIAGVNKEKYGIDYCNSHLLKNSEWGAVAYLCYSQYGNVPMKNACGAVTSGKSSNWYYNLTTGQGPQNDSNDNGKYAYSDTSISSHGYSTSNGQKASTTENVTGIYDMNGGAWEYVAAYLDNKSENLGYGNSTISGADKYFSTQYELNSGYSELWDKYEVSSEERNDQIEVTEGKISKGTLWNASKIGDTYSLARYRLTKYIFDHLPKGIGVSEISDKFSFYNAYNNGKSNTWDWFRFTGTEDTPAFTRSATTSVWDSDYVLIGHASNPFVIRGGYYNNGTNAGVFYSNISSGSGYYYYGFRSALVL